MITTQKLSQTQRMIFRLFFSASDERLKENIEDVSFSGIDIVNNLQVRNFNFKSQPDSTQIGFIAQEVQPFVPEAVDILENGIREMKGMSSIMTEEEEAQSISEEGKPLGFSREALIPYLVKAVQELSVENEVLRQEIELLKQ